MIRNVVSAAAALAIAIGLATAPAASAQEPKRGGILKYGVKAEPETFDIHATNTYVVMHYLPQHYSTLLSFDVENFPALEGDLATSWEVSDDGLTYTFKLREGVEFHDGTPFTSEDVKATFDRMRDPPEGEISAREPLFGSIESIDTPDNHTVVFNLSTPDSALLQIIASQYSAIYSAEDIAKPGNWHRDHINGTGPFVFVEQVPGSHWVTRRYEKYHHDDVYLDGTIVYLIDDVVTALAGGQIMAEWRSVSPPERDQLVKLMGDNVKFLEGPWLTEFMVTLNTDFEPFQDQRVRQALNLCIDRYEALENLSKITIISPFPSGHLLATSDWALPDEELEAIPGFGRDIEANRQRARELLQEAGHEGLSFTYSNRAVAHPYDQVGIWLIAQWRQCGLNPKMVTNPTSKFVQMRTNGKFDATIDWNSNFVPDPTLMLAKHLSAERNPQNYAGFTDKEIDASFEAQRQETDPEKRKEIVHKMGHKLLEDAWTLPISQMARIVALNSKVMGYQLAPTHVLNTDWRGVWIDE